MYKLTRLRIIDKLFTTVFNIFLATENTCLKDVNARMKEKDAEQKDTIQALGNDACYNIHFFAD